MHYAAQYQSNQSAAQTDLFGEVQTISVAEIDLPEVEPWSKVEQLSNEKEVVGFFISGHPLETYQLELKQFSTTNIAAIKEHWANLRGRKLNFGAVITAAAHLVTKNGNGYGRCTVEDFDESMELTLFGEDYLRFRHLLNVGEFVYIYAEIRPRWNREGGELELKVLNMIPLADLMDKNTRQVEMLLDLQDITPDFTQKMKDLCKEYMIPKKAAASGGASVNFHVVDHQAALSLNMPLHIKVKASDFVPALKASDLKMEIHLK